MTNCKSKDIQWLSDILATISQVYRLQIICLLNTKWELCVCDIVDDVQVKQNLVSHHLNILKELWLLTTRREGKKIFYSLDKIIYKKLKEDFKKIFNI